MKRSFHFRRLDLRHPFGRLRNATRHEAAEGARLSQAEFQCELGQRKIPINYTLEDLQSDLQAVRELKAK